MESSGTNPAGGVSSNGPAMVATSIAFLVLAWLTVLLRFWVRQIMLRSLGLDDWMMGITLLTFTLFCAFLMVEVSHGGGSNVSPTTQLHTLGELLKYVLVSECLYIVTMIFLKISLGIFFLRIVIRPWHAIFVYAIMTVSTAFGIAYFFFALFQCGNPTKILENKLAGHCQSASTQLGMGYTHASVQAFSDWAFASLPVIILWDAKMDRRTKASVAFILMLGAAGSTATLVRFRYESGLVDEEDFFFAAAYIAITCTIEAGLGITAGSLATLRPLFKSCFDRVRTTISSEQRTKYGGPKTPFSGSKYGAQRSVTGEGNSFRPFDNGTVLADLKSGTRTIVTGNHRSRSSSDEEMNLELVPKNRSSPQSPPPGWISESASPSPNRSWFKIERTTDVEVTNETWRKQDDLQ